MRLRSDGGWRSQEMGWTAWTGGNPGEAAAHVAGFHGQEHFQVVGKTQHGRGLLSSRIKVAASWIWPGVVMRSFAPPGSRISMARPVPVTGAASSSAGTNDKNAGHGKPGTPDDAARLRFWIQPAMV